MRINPYGPLFLYRLLRSVSCSSRTILVTSTSNFGGPGWTRTNDVSYVTDLQSAEIATIHTDPYEKNIPRLSTEQKVGVHKCVNQILVIPHKETKSPRLESTTKRRRHLYKKVCVLDSFYYHASSK